PGEDRRAALAMPLLVRRERGEGSFRQARNRNRSDADAGSPGGGLQPMSNPLRLQPLPAPAQALLEQHSAPPRLVAHLTLTHDVAARLVTGIRKHWPDLPLDVEAVRFGAATHDLGKVTYPEELQQPGNRHEAAGEQLLLAA